ncbi:hypothetical protein ACN4GA_01925 [Raoultella terrigena]|uniref:Uncharacterized protein n=1 Tax=Raoultella terrigena TaxID=577 RepID=A0AAP9XLN1_RAOTE|nr:hypothetical protein [Raoultella terrigena]QPF06934.1 hypothetical protein IMO34_16405 [Raoultella terrigena]
MTAADDHIQRLFSLQGPLCVLADDAEFDSLIRSPPVRGDTLSLYAPSAVLKSRSPVKEKNKPCASGKRQPVRLPPGGQGEGSAPHRAKIPRRRSLSL